MRAQALHIPKLRHEGYHDRVVKNDQELVIVIILHEIHQCLRHLSVVLSQKCKLSI